ncbi:hypothetical protein J0H58_13595 [bacterium]|nr:hypothetical protein [bacterium]
MEGVFVGAAIVVVVLFVVGWLLVIRQSELDVHDRFPPISDAEFIARCTPGTTPEVALKVRRIIAEQLAVEYERIHPSMSFVEDIGAD